MSRTKTPTLNIILGAMTFGKPGAEQTRVHSLPACSAILDVFQRHGHREIDTARFYGEGSSEEYLGQLDWQKRGLIMDTSTTPRRDAPCPNPTNPPEDGNILPNTYGKTSWTA